ncbi:uncharacterized protein LOC144145604 isoform X1 [Haemaphysalis longicornis]
MEPNNSANARATVTSNDHCDNRNASTTEDKAAKRRERDAERKRLKRAADSELRKRDNERKRLKRAADAELRQREAAAVREKRAANAELRQREAAAVREKRAADPELRQREAAAAREKRAADPELRQREAAAKRQRRAADPSTVRQTEAAAQRKRRAANPDAVRQAEAAAKRRRRQRDRTEAPSEPPRCVASPQGSPHGKAPCLHHSYGQLVDQLSCVTPMMLPCTCSKELNGTSTSQHVDSEVVTTTTKTEPEESAASDEEFFEMPLAVEMETGEGPCNLPVSIKEEPLDIPAVPTEDAGEADEILGVTGIETLVVAAQCRAKGEAEIGSRTSEEEACSS